MQPSLVRLFMWYGEGRRLFALCGGGAAGVLLLPVAALVFVEPYADEGRDDEGDGEADEPSDVEHGAEGVEGVMRRGGRRRAGVVPRGISRAVCRCRGCIEP